MPKDTSEKQPPASEENEVHGDIDIDTANLAIIRVQATANSLINDCEVAYTALQSMLDSAELCRALGISFETLQTYIGTMRNITAMSASLIERECGMGSMHLKSHHRVEQSADESGGGFH